MGSTATFGTLNVEAGRARGWFIAVGSLLLILGIVGLFMVVTLTIASTLWYGILLIAAGIAEIVEALAKPVEVEVWRSRAVRFLAGLLYLVGGLWAVFRPLEASLALTLVLGLTLIASGVARAIWAIVHETQMSRATVILFAVLSMLLGAAIIAQWPYSGLWAIGLFVSCDLIAAGLSWAWIGLFGKPPIAPAIASPGIGSAAR
jgi:uncharacterized membrane protein HdeD (DUF308 family)